jgi:sugar phosphate isomerase/epimerase
MPDKPFKLSFQLYTARSFPPQEAVLAGLAEIGYDAVEAFPPDYIDDPTAFRRRLDAAGLACTGFHMPFKGLVEEPDRFIDIARTIGDHPLMIPPFLPTRDRPDDIDGWKRIGDQLAKGAEKARAAGLRLAWHNHEFEFRMLPDGSRPIDHMLAGPEVGLELDIAWVLRGWADPVAELTRFASRILAIQIKDTAAPGTLDDENGWRAAGDGVADWDRLFPLFPTTAADQLIVEHDRPVDWRRTAQRSFDFASSRLATTQSTA